MEQNIQLRELEENELISPVVPPKVEYSLTKFGKSLISVVSSLGQGGDENEERLRNIILSRQKTCEPTRFYARKIFSSLRKL